MIGSRCSCHFLSRQSSTVAGHTSAISPAVGQAPATFERAHQLLARPRKARGTGPSSRLMSVPCLTKRFCPRRANGSACRALPIRDAVHCPTGERAMIEPVTAEEMSAGFLAMNPVRDARRPAARIIEEVAKMSGLTVGDIKGHIRDRHIVKARHFAMWRCRGETDLSLPALGREFGGRDHTTILHGVRRWEQHWSKQ